MPCHPDLATVFDDSKGELMRLKQKGSVQDYQDQFEELPESYAASCFLSGLKEELQLSVRMFMPTTLQHDCYQMLV